MKRVLTQFLAISSLGLLILSSCKNSDVRPVSTGGKAGALSANTTMLVLNKSMVNDTSTVINFSFTATNYGFKSAATNTLQIDPAGDNWAHPASLTLNNNVYSQGFSTAAFNAMLLKLNLTAGVASQVNVRIVNSLSPNVASVYSNTVALTVTPFNLTSWIYVPGDYEGWGNPGAQEDSLISVTGNGVYTGIIDFRGYAGSTGSLQFKLVPVKGSWNVSYGDAGGGTISTSGGNITAPTAAPYLVTVNLNTNTITLVAADYYSVTGDAATGWGNDTFMKYINDGNDNWVVTLPLASTGAFKIRQDAQWTNSWGTSSTTGVLTDANGGNISIPTTGNYIVSFNMAPSAYGSPAVATAAYTVTAQ